MSRKDSLGQKSYRLIVDFLVPPKIGEGVRMKEKKPRSSQIEKLCVRCGKKAHQSEISIMKCTLHKRMDAWVQESSGSDRQSCYLASCTLDGYSQDFYFVSHGARFFRAVNSFWGSSSLKRQCISNKLVITQVHQFRHQWFLRKNGDVFEHVILWIHIPFISNSYFVLSFFLMRQLDFSLFSALPFSFPLSLLFLLWVFLSSFLPFLSPSTLCLLFLLFWSDSHHGS